MGWFVGGVIAHNVFNVTVTTWASCAVWASCAKGVLAERRTSFCGFLGQSFFFKQTLFYLSLQVKLRLCFFIVNSNGCFI